MLNNSIATNERQRIEKKCIQFLCKVLDVGEKDGKMTKLDASDIVD